MWDRKITLEDITGLQSMHIRAPAIKDILHKRMSGN